MNQNEVDEAIAEINKKVKSRILVFVILGVILIAIGIILIVFVDIMPGIMFMVFGVLFPVGGLSFAKNRAIKVHLIPFVIKKALGKSAIYRPFTGYDSSELMKMDMFRVHTLSQEDYISAVYKGVKFRCADVESYETHSDGDGHTSRTTYFDGIVLVYEFNKPFDGEIRVAEKEIGSSQFIIPKHLKEIHLESTEFEDNYDAYASDEHIGFYVLTPQLIMQLNKIRTIIKGTFLFQFKEDKLYIAINGAKNRLEAGLTKKLNRETVDKLCKELDPLKLICDVMNLDNTYFKENHEILNNIDQEKKKTAKKLRRELKEKISN
ncbi:MAG TPA: hypothetical protein DCY93_00555 [Firmicutes bacterium]|nr:hypothetical protein [Bacillota bacterium]